MTAVKPGSVVTIYAIWCKRNGHRYVGATGATVSRRWSSHKAALVAGKHGTALLQRAWDRFGASAFVVDTLERAVVYDDAAQREAYWIGNFPRVFNTGDPRDLGTHAQKYYVVTSPDGAVFEVVNLNRFCRDRGFPSACLTLVAQCRKPSHRGWTCRYTTMAPAEWARRQAAFRKARDLRSKLYRGGYRVTAPDGYRYVVMSLRPWAEARGLDASALVRVARGEARHHHGFVASFVGKGG